MNIVLPDGSQKELCEGATVYSLAESIGAGLARAALAGKIDGKEVDLNTPLHDGAVVEIITTSSDEALSILRHSCAHVMAEAVQIMFPGAQIAYGPDTDDGFYYDFELPRSITPDDFEQIEKIIKDIIAKDEPFVRKEVTREEAYEIFKDQKFKLEHLNELADADIQLTVYQHGNFVDLCKGPHVPSAKWIGACKLMKIAGAYWKADAKREMLQRLYGTAFFKKKDLEDYLHLLEEAEKRDHRKIGKEMELFTFRDEAPGFPFFLPNGTVIKNELIAYWRELHREAGYVEVCTPMIMNRQLWETSGHWDHYKDNMYSTEIDDEPYCVKPMNCPGGVLVYANKMHSYRELPLRIGELGLVHRHEMRGALHGLFRVRCFTQDDAHIFMRPDQIPAEIKGVIDLINKVYSKFGFDYFIELSTRPEDSMGSDEDWEVATNGLKRALEDLGLEYKINEGDGAFYGPKIDFHLRDCIGRTWQCGTIQLDFQMPLNFQLEYVDSDGSRKRPIMIHRVLFGSIERFTGILTENYAGKFPTWLAPIQVKVLPVSEKSFDYSHEVMDTLSRAGVRCVIDERGETIGYKIREARQVDRVPYMIILGEKEIEKGIISVRDRATDKTNEYTLDDFVEMIAKEIKERV